MTKRTREKGFTIVEMLVVLVVLAIVIALTVNVSRTALKRSGFSGAVNQFVADYNYARGLAARQNRYVAFEFDEDNGAYRMLIQRATHVDLKNTDNYTFVKWVAPLAGETADREGLIPRDWDNTKFFTATNNFAVNSMGIIRKYPVDVTTQPINISINFYIKKGTTRGDENAYTRDLLIFPYGGLRLTDPMHGK